LTSSAGGSTPDDLRERAKDRAFKQHLEQSQQIRAVPAPSDLARGVFERLAAEQRKTSAPRFDVRAHLSEYGRVLFGTVSFSALLMFGSTWMLALTEPSLAFAMLATFLSFALLVTTCLRIAWELAAGAAANPLLMLLAMSAPLIAFMFLAAQLPRRSAQLTHQARQQARRPMRGA
jgi:hypothetical protein